MRCSVAVNIAIVGLSLYGSGFSGVGNCMQVSMCEFTPNESCLSPDYPLYTAAIATAHVPREMI